MLTIRSIRADGVALAPELYRIDAGWLLVESPAIACGGSEFVAAWWILNGGVTAVRLRGTQAGEIGEPFTDLADFRAAPVDRFEPEVVSMADDFLVTSVSKGTLYRPVNIERRLRGRANALLDGRASARPFGCPPARKKSWWLPTCERPTMRRTRVPSESFCAFSICNEAISS